MPVQNFENITRRLDINPASVDSTYNKTRAKGRIIGKVPYTFTVPEFSTTTTAHTGGKIGCLMAQYNYTFPRSFKILKTSVVYADYSNLFPTVAIKYRIGTTVYRYYLPWSNPMVALPIDQYNGELIQPNFCLEYWCRLSSGFGSNYFVQEVLVTTNLLANPTSPDELYVNTAPTESLLRATLAQAMPETLPVTYVSGSSWLTN